MDEIRMAIECREDEGRLGPGRLFGVLMAYGERAQDRAEVFESGSLSWPADGVVLNRQHQRASPIARIVPTIEGDKVMINAPLPDTTAGRDAASDFSSGLSVEFKATAQRIVGGVRRITEAVLSGAAIVDSPSYAGASVEVRSKGGGNRPNEGTLWL